MTETEEDTMDVQSDDDIAEKELELKLSSLTEILANNPYDYQTHIDKINLLKKMGELEDLRDARKSFSKMYPLSPDLWMDWIKDEQKLVGSSEEREKVYELFENAVKDYVSVNLWLEYCSFALGDVGTESGVHRAREVFEKAVLAVGNDVASGSLIWDAYREFENAVQSFHSEGLQYVVKVFTRQLSLPFLNMTETWNEFEQIIESTPGLQIDLKIIKKNHDSALKSLKEREEFEDNLIRKTPDNFEDFTSYIDFEKKNGSPIRVQYLYERRITDHCLIPEAWIEYLDYFNQFLKSSEVSLSIHKRSLRNCPWSGDLWIKYMRSLIIYYPSDFSKINSLLEECLTSGLSNPADYSKLWFEFLSYSRRRFDDPNNSAKLSEESFKDLFNKALNHLERIPGSDPTMRISRLWASLLGDRFKDMESARKIWATITSTHLGEDRFYWIEYSNLEKNFGDDKHVRKAFLRGMEKVRDQLEHLSENWLQFESEEGSLDQLKSAEIQISRCMSIHQERIIKDKEESAKNKKPDVRKRKNGIGNRPEGLNEHIKKKPKTESAEPFKTPLPVASTVKPPPGFSGKLIKPPPGFPGSKVPEEKSQNVIKEKTIFISNLSFDVDEEKIKNIMSSSGIVLDVRLAKNSAGKSRGFAYVEFKTEEGAIKAVARDNELLDGRPLYISTYQEGKEGHTFKYAVSLEKNKLFVKGLKFSATKEQVINFFGKYGVVKDVRIVTFRNGKSKGLAYVEYENESEASGAILKTDGVEFLGHPISVALSNPPEKKKEFSKPTAPILGGRKPPTLQLIPRSVVSTTTTIGPKKSNQDFREFIFKTK